MNTKRIIPKQNKKSKETYKSIVYCNSEEEAKKIMFDDLDFKTNPNDFAYKARKIKDGEYEVVAERIRERRNKPCVCPEIDKAIRREAKMFSDPTWNLMTSNGFYNWG